ncbi:protein TIC 62, chloroplastic isoform X1 [Musa acuminata AAA Group]|uniref:protein TIC 62, chloroplastic isoform X1 n=1 Tax=Musa acuminata AAA Group TaxID=214697 RepID=UPI0031DF6C6D
MEVFSLRSLPCAARPPSRTWKRALVERLAAVSGRSLPAPGKPSRCPRDGNPRSLCSRPRASAAVSSDAKAGEVSKQEMSSKDKDLVFVAGATGRVGSRLVRELLKFGFRVRAGVRSAQRAEPLVQSVQQMKPDVGTGPSGTEPAAKLELVECDLEKQGDIGPAIGNASTVLCCIGASEKEISDITGPYRIDYKATENLIKAATVAKVDHFILLTSLGTNKFGLPAAILNLFWGVLFWKRKAEEALIASGLPYTIVRPGGMERPTDSYKETHNIVLANEDTYFGGQVSNLQVAELMAFMAKNRKISYCKVVEVIAETTAPLLPMDELLSKIPSQREPPAEIVKDVARSSTEPKPTKLVVEEEPEKTEGQKTRPLSPYYMYADLKPPSSPTPIPSATPGSSKEKQVEFVQAKSEPEPTSASLSASKLSEDVAKKEAGQVLAQKTRPLSPYTAYEDLKPPSSPSPVDCKATTNPVIPESPEVPHGNSSYRSPFPVYEDLRPPASPAPSLPKY